MSNLTDTILWLRSFLGELSKPQKSRTPILTDSRGTLLACYNSIGEKKIRHLEIHLHSIRERTKRLQVVPVWIPGRMQIADIFTKPLPHAAFNHLRSIIFGLKKLELPEDTREHSKEYNSIKEKNALKILRRELDLD